MLNKQSVSSLSKQYNEHIITLLIDSDTVVHIGDKPIFGDDVTINENVRSLVGTILLPGVILGWVNYVDISKFACITPDNRYIEATNFLHTSQNKIVVSTPIKIHDVDANMSHSKNILRFSALT
ncbi:MAG: hypothetical protein ACJAVV_001213 [Alphaproteobacteria bacterium]|jgi:hypothetical protein